jgi:hypothetical protein
MIAYKMYQLPSRLPTHHAARQINTSAANPLQPGLGEGPAARGRGGRGLEGHPRGSRRTILSPQPMRQAAGIGGGVFAQENVSCLSIKH